MLFGYKFGEKSEVSEKYYLFYYIFLIVFTFELKINKYCLNYNFIRIKEIIYKIYNY